MAFNCCWEVVTSQDELINAKMASVRKNVHTVF